MAEKRFRNVYLLGLVSLFTDLSSQMVFPLIPLFMTSVLGAGAMMVGLVEGGAEAVASILKALSGKCSAGRGLAWGGSPFPAGLHYPSVARTSAARSRQVCPGAAS